MRRTVPFIFVCLLLTTTAPAFAQQRLFAWMAPEVVELDPRSGTLGTVIRRFPLPTPPRDSNNDVVSFGGGEFLAWTTEWDGGNVVLLNTHSGAVLRFTFPGFFPRGVIGTDGNARLLVLGTHQSAKGVVLVADARSGSVRFLDVPSVSVFSPAITYAPAADVLFVARPRGLAADTYHDVDVIQVGTGALLETLDIFPASARGLSSNAAGTRLYVSASTGTSAYDVLSGAQFASNPAGAFGALEELRNRLVSHVFLPPGATPEDRARRGIAAYSADSLQLIGRVQVPELTLPAPQTPDDRPFLAEAIDFSGLSATIFVLQGTGVGFKYFSGTNRCHESQLMALNADTGEARRIVDTTAALGPWGCTARLVRVTEPPPPAAAAAAISGRQVTLQWPATFGATRYEVEVGVAPSLTNLTIGTTGPRLVVDDVPAGVYYLRLRAINTIGKSAASGEVQVIVQ